MNTDVSPALQSESPNLSNELVEVHMMRELFKRTRESSFVGPLPVLLVAWAHLGAQPAHHLVVWVASVFLVLGFRLLVAHTFLSQPQNQSARRHFWFQLEWMGGIMLAATWVSGITLLGTGEVDILLYLRLTFLVGLVAFMLSALGIDLRLYGSFMTVVVGGTLVLLHMFYPRFVAELPVVTTGFIVYGVMLLVRSRSENRRTREWVSARLTQKQLMDQLSQTIRQEQETHEALRVKSLELEATNRQLGKLAIYDGLTGAFRRDHIEGELHRKVMIMQRKPGDFSAMLLDLDFFKLVNDRHGHAVGDEVLRRVAVQVQDTLRGNDLFGRWGGEEFVVLMPDTGIVEAIEAAERVREAVRELEFIGHGYRFCITVSIGVAQLEPMESADMLAQRIDKALYAAKHAGRDRVLAYEPGDSLFSDL